MRSVNLMMLLSVGWAWGVLLVVGGAWLATRSAEFPPASRPAVVVGGVTSVLAGQFVFLVMVADRLFPGVRRDVKMITELALAALLVAGAAATVTILLGVVA